MNRTDILSVTGMALILALITPVPAVRAAAPAAHGGSPFISVTLDPDGESALIRASIDIPGGPAPIWRAMTDCDANLRMIRSMVGCRVMQKGAGWDIREHVTRGGPLLPSFRYLVRSDYEPLRRIRFRKIDGNLKTLEGEWGLTALDGGRATRVTYENRVAARILAPPFVVRAGLRRDTPRVLENLRRLVTGEG